MVPRAGIEPFKNYHILQILSMRSRIEFGKNVIQIVIQYFATFSLGITPSHTHGRSDNRRHPARFCAQIISLALTPPTPPFEAALAPSFQISARKVASVSGKRFRLASIRARQRGPRDNAS